MNYTPNTQTTDGGYFAGGTPTQNTNRVLQTADQLAGMTNAAFVDFYRSLPNNEDTKRSVLRLRYLNNSNKYAAMPSAMMSQREAFQSIALNTNLINLSLLEKFLGIDASGGKYLLRPSTYVAAAVLDSDKTLEFLMPNDLLSPGVRSFTTNGAVPGTAESKAAIPFFMQLLYTTKDTPFSNNQAERDLELQAITNWATIADTKYSRCNLVVTVQGSKVIDEDTSVFDTRNSNDYVNTRGGSLVSLRDNPFVFKGADQVSIKLIIPPGISLPNTARTVAFILRFPVMELSV